MVRVNSFGMLVPVLGWAVPTLQRPRINDTDSRFSCVNLAV